MKWKENKDEAMYGFPPPLGKDSRCQLCKYFSPILKTVLRDGTCAKVNGIINPDSGCMNFDPPDMDLSQIKFRYQDG